MRHFLTTLIILLIAGISTFSADARRRRPARSSSTTVSAPDFAFPKRVITDADASLKSALARNNGPAILRAVIDKSIALGEIDRDRLPEAFSEIDSLTSVVKGDDTRAMLLLLRAFMLNEVYNSDEWNFNQRNLPLRPFPADFREWSGAQFTDTISTLLNQVMDYAPVLAKAKISDWSSDIILEDDSRVYYPTLLDFAAWQAIDLLDNNSDDLYIPISLLRSPISSYPYLKPVSRDILKWFDILLDTNRDHTAPYIRALVGKSNAISSANLSDEMTDYLYECYDRFASSEYSALIIRALDSSFYGQDRRLYDIASAYLKRFPNSSLSGCVAYIVTRMTRPELSFKYPYIVAPSTDCKLDFESTMLDSASVKIYRLDPIIYKTTGYTIGSLSGKKPVDTVKVRFAGEAPFYNDTVTVNYSFPSEGIYAMVPSFDGADIDLKAQPRTIHVTYAVGFTTSGIDSTSIWIVNPVDGHPLHHAMVDALAGNWGSRHVVEVGLTDKDGRITPDSKYHNFFATSGNSVTPNISVWSSYRERAGETKKAVITTSLPLYHLGDTVSWAVYAYATNQTGQRVLPGQSLTVTLYDTNGQKVESTDVVSDSMGRTTGSFALPATGLTGNFRIEATSSDDTGREKSIYETNYFTVSDYKLPTFAISSIKALPGTPAKGDVTVSGQATAYSGFPIAGADVTLSVSVKSTPWRWDDSDNFYSATTTTAADGSFSVVLPAGLLDNSPIPDGYYTATVSVTSPTGETRSDGVSFMRGQAYTIDANIDGNLDISAPVSLDIKVFDAEYKTVDSLIDYTLTDDNGNDVVSGQQFNTPSPTVDWTDIPSGKYKLTLALPDTTLAETVTRNIILYRPTDTVSPVADSFWSPVSKLTVKRGEKASILYATTEPETNILVSVSGNDRLFSQRWVKTRAGMHTIAIDVPDSVTSLDVTFGGVAAYQPISHETKITVDKAAPAIDVTSETFRDRISPGAVETWTFKVINQNDEGVKAAMLFDMYNSALNGVGSSQWKAPLFLKPSLRNLDLNHNNFGKGHNILYSKIANSRCNPPSCPIFNTYDQILGHASIPSFRVVGYGVVAAAPQSRMAKAELKEESADLAMDMAANDAGHVLAAEAVQEAIPAPPFSYRDSEVALAFFRPSVTTDNQGNASLTFTVPNANTSWTFNTFAFTPDLTSTSFYCNVISSKPVMVQPNLPRFLRSGDKAVIRAAVMNNSDRTSEITTTIELFNPVNGDIIKTATSTASLAAGADTTAVITVDTPLDCSMIGYRVKSSDKSFADGEQNIIPVLPATQPVLETYPFYMAPDSASYHGEIPARPADARVTMTFCENPVWEVVTALPGLLKDEAMTAPDAAEAIFSACVAEGILRDNPAIATELHRWLTSDRSDSTLVSMLSRNSDLKTFVLSATPWVQAAESDTERMTRLALLFDRKTIDNAIDANLTLLKKLQMPSGAFRWMQQSDYPSQWATSRVLCLLGSLSEMGHLPKDKRVQPMIKSALEWLDTEVVKDYRRYPDGDFSSWTYLHTFYPKASTTASARRVINATVQRLVSGWKDEDVPGKAKAAIILNANGYSSTASQVLKSLREYSVYSPERGMHWPSLDNLGFFSAYTKVSATAFALDAFRTVEPGCADIDRIRQWLILQKEAQDWGNSTATTATVAAILNSSRRFIKPARGAVINVGGHEIEPDAFQRATGSLRSDITAFTPAVGTDFDVVRPGDAPSWGSVYIQYIGEMAGVKASSCDDISIEKQLYRLAPDGTGIHAVDASDLSVGDLVKVELLIKCERDIDYVAIEDRRPACFEPVEQLPRPIWSEGICFYRENRDAATNIFVTRLPKGVYRLSYEMRVNNAGTFTSGVATLQSQYCPALSAHSSGAVITVK